jgi:hypothetical protein
MTATSISSGEVIRDGISVHIADASLYKDGMREWNRLAKNIKRGLTKYVCFCHDKGTNVCCRGQAVLSVRSTSNTRQECGIN